MISEYVFFIFLVAISVYISNEDTKTFKRLANLNNELEDRIRERTKELETSNQKLQAIATTDQLTGLYNRHQFVQILTREEDRIQRYRGKEGTSFALLFIDLDNFKHYNDNFGHAAGDLVLSLFAKLLSETLQTSDTAARYSGDEFLVLLPNTLEAGALILAHRILKKVDAAKGYITEISQHLGRAVVVPREQYLSCSIGISSYDTASGQSGAELLQAADQALYEAKSSGKHCVKIWRGQDSAISEA